ncbi:MAG: 2-oxoglutarate dehydrogenase complex dihydrolipoyllysine-residue succinyltransferase [Rickettsiales bacterium]
MATKDIVVPTLGESVSEATIAKWFKKVGDAVKVDEPLCELETDKVTVEVPSPAAGALKEILAADGSNVGVGAILGKIEVGASGAVSAAAPVAPAPAPVKAAAPAAAPIAVPAAANGPAVTKMLAENPQVNPANIAASGKDGRLTKGDVIAALESDGMGTSGAAGPREERVKMTKLRQTIARRLKDSQNTAAILTTFNEIDMTNVIALRNEYKDEFEKKHGIKLGFMGFFIKAAVNALKQVPAVNAEIAGDDIIYKNYYDIGVAVGGAQGLVVPVVRDCDKKSLAQIEADIAAYADKARAGTLSMAEMTGGTFTVSNGGVYGSLMSTPIVNPPQSGILGMHKTEERPIALNGQVVIRPMMYVALSYDHRIIDGRESVTFLVKVKQAIEDPRRLLLGL